MRGQGAASAFEPAVPAVIHEVAMRTRRRIWLTVVVGVALAQAGTSSALADPAYAPLNQPGPALSPTLAQLKASLSCEPGVAHAKTEPVLLNPGTATTPSENFGWNWEPALDMLGIPGAPTPRRTRR